jgi:hypothetical protein
MYTEEPDSITSVLDKQPETRSISQEQLVAEVKEIYAGLTMVEAKCIEAENERKQQTKEAIADRLSHEQWQALILIALHRTLLLEHHDFFLASQHSSASLALRSLATKYAMLARMWRHGIHSSFELLGQRLPTGQEHMLSFIHLAYSMMALLYETVTVAAASLVAANPALAGDRYRTPKLMLLGTSAVSSLGTGLASLQLEIPNDLHATRLVKMCLRIACSTFLGTLAVGYSLWFLPYAQKRHRFLSGLGAVGLFLWMFMRRDPSPAANDMGDAFAWLDDLNLFGLIAVVAGILNAESSLMTSAFPHDDTDRVTSDGDENANERDYRRPADEESQNSRHDDERDRRGEGQSQADHQDVNGDFELAVLSSIAQTVADA